VRDVIQRVARVCDERRVQTAMPNLVNATLLKGLDETAQTGSRRMSLTTLLKAEFESTVCAEVIDSIFLSGTAQETFPSTEENLAFTSSRHRDPNPVRIVFTVRQTISKSRVNEQCFT
jgi:hypothetical protein